MAAKFKHAVSRIPLAGYALHWLVDLIKLPLIRLDLVREIENLRSAQQRFEAIHVLQQERYAELVEGISALRRSFGDALTQLDVLYGRIAPPGEDSVGAAEARADLRKLLWAMERRLSKLERVSSQREPSPGVDRPGIH